MRNGNEAESAKIGVVTADSLTIADNGKSVRLRAGDTITVRLPENPSTGWRWQVETLDAALLVTVDTGYKVYGTGVGGGGLRTLSFRGVSPGKGVLVLTERRPWRKADSSD